MGSREDVRVALSQVRRLSKDYERLPPRGGRSHDLRRDEPPDATQAGEWSGVKARTVTDLPFAKLFLSLRFNSATK